MTRTNYMKICAFLCWMASAVTFYQSYQGYVAQDITNMGGYLFVSGFLFVFGVGLYRTSNKEIK